MSPHKSDLSIIICCKNEGAGIQRILDSLEHYRDDIIVIDGNSNDGTEETVRNFGATFLLDHGLGRGDAVKIGIEHAKGDVLVFFDADGSHEATDISALVAPIVTDGADLVIGSRRTGGSFDITVNFTGIIRSAGCDVLVGILNHRFGTSLTDILYSFRAIRSSAARQLELRSDGFGIEQEMVVECLARHLKVIEVPSREKARQWGASKLHTLEGIKFFLSLLGSLYLRKR